VPVYLPLSIVRAFSHRFGSTYLLLRLSALECLTSLTDGLTYYASADFCPAVRRPLDPLSRLGGDTEQISGVSSIAFGAQPPDLRFAPLMDMDFAISCPLVGAGASYPVFVHRLAPLIRASSDPPRGNSPCASLPFTSSGW